MNKLIFTAGLAAAAAFAQTSTTPVTTSANPTFPGNELSRTITLQANLNSLNENPPLTARPASGMAMLALRLDRTSTANTSPSTAHLQVTITATTTMNEVVTAAHIHRGRAGNNGPVVLDFQLSQAASSSPTTIATVANQAATVTQQVNITSADQLKLLEEIVAKPADFYVNVHTQSTPDGHIRGHLMTTADDRLNSVDNRFSGVDADLIEIRRMLVALSFKAGVITNEQRDAQIAALDNRVSVSK